jgi:regulator of protease activity HflC (stomatin/prohibitin superfamily)
MESLIAVAVLALFGYTVGSMKVIDQGYEGIVQRLGRFQRTLKPGLNFVVPFFDSVLVESTREQLLDIDPQAVTTKDNVSIKVDAIIYWRILDVEKAYYEIEDLDLALENLVLGSLRSQIGQMTLNETFSNRDKVNQALLRELDQATEPWGVKIVRVELQEIVLPEALQRALEQERTAETAKRAELLQSQATVQSIEQIAKAFESIDRKNADAVMRFLMTQRYVDANYKLSESNNSKIIFMDPKSLSETVGELIGADTTEGLDVDTKSS